MPPFRYPFRVQACALALLAGLARAPASGDPAPLPALPPSNHTPFEVQISLFVLDVSSVNDTEESFDADVYLRLEWKDPRVASSAQERTARVFVDEAAAARLSEMWQPLLWFPNLIGDPDTSQQYLSIQQDGSVLLTFRILGQFRGSFEFAAFPLDKQRLRLSVESYAFESSELRLVESTHRNASREPFTLPGWKVRGIHSEVADFSYATGEAYSRYSVEIPVERSFWYYFWQIVFPLTLLGILGCTSLLLEPDALGERISIILTSLLTIAAQDVATKGDLPKVSYFTLIDLAFLCTYLVLLVLVAESVIADKIGRRNIEKAENFDWIFSFVVPLTYLGVMAAILGFGKAA